jgi:hypothetical protein
LLGVVGIGGPSRVEVGIGEAVVDGGQAGGCGHAEHAHLDRRRLASEDEQAIVGGVEGEVDENIDPVGADPVGELKIAQAGDAAPGAGKLLQLLGDTVGSPHVGVGHEVSRRVVAMRPEGEQQPADWVVAKVG